MSSRSCTIASYVNSWTMGVRGSADLSRRRRVERDLCVWLWPPWNHQAGFWLM
jgi:hypothetical protein